MKKLIAILLMLVTAQTLSAQFTVPFAPRVPSSGTHALSITQSVNCALNGSTYTSSMTCTIASTIAGHSLLIGCGDSGAGTITSFTPAAVAVGTPNNTGGSYGNSTVGGMWIVSNVTAGTTSLVVNFPINYVGIECQVNEVAGVVTASPVDQTIGVTSVGGYGNGNASALTGSVTTTNANDVIIGWVGAYGITFTAGTGYTLFPTTGGNFIFEYKNVSSTGSYNPGMTWTNTNYYASETAALKLQ